jgi:hypothetical protein
MLNGNGALDTATHRVFDGAEAPTEEQPALRAGSQPPQELTELECAD